MINGVNITNVYLFAALMSSLLLIVVYYLFLRKK